MSQSTATPIAAPAVQVPVVPLLQLGTWVVFFGLLAMLAIFFVSADQRSEEHTSELQSH